MGKLMEKKHVPCATWLLNAPHDVCGGASQRRFRRSPRLTREMPDVVLLGIELALRLVGVIRMQLVFCDLRLRLPRESGWPQKSGPGYS